MNTDQIVEASLKMLRQDAALIAQTMGPIPDGMLHWLGIGYALGVQSLLVQQKHQHYQLGMVKLHGIN